ncbi:hypothetical protein A9Q87_05755 [Flavobacteriales bacterium 34_180_T64]|nr:hypothetical protein A9Q87_05755 [Flavobacteriales bacterium 34_180_T64]
MLAAYALLYFQLPKLLYKKKYLLFALSLIITSYVFSVLARLLVVHLVEELVRERPFEQESVTEILTDLKALYSRYSLVVYFPAFIMLMYSLIIEKFSRKNQMEQLQKEKFSAELNFFKAQIHPHFLFNTLNNLYALTLQKSDKASDTVLKLSEILDYMLYQCNDSRVPVVKELKLIQNYIALEQLRYGDRLELNFNHEIDNLNTQIAPLILMSLIENAFKHGASGSINKPIIKIDIQVANGLLQFSIYNTKNTINQEDLTNYKKGIGMSNTKKQLELLYPDKHLLTINEESSSYEVKLHVDLNE